MSGPETYGSSEEDDHLYEERREALFGVVEQYLEADDHEFLLGIEDEDERNGYVYGKLLELGEDPDVVLQVAGVFEKQESDNELVPTPDGDESGRPEEILQDIILNSRISRGVRKQLMSQMENLSFEDKVQHMILFCIGTGRDHSVLDQLLERSGDEV